MSENHDQRKLAAIMFTDMVGFSALSQRDEALALELLAEHRGLLREIVPRHGGREVKTMGDGFLFEFSSALAAVQSALEMQRRLHDRNQALPARRHVQIRLGIHVGDVVASDGDIHGDGVNLAARLEPLAAPGGVCVSQAVYEQVRNKVDVGFVSLGETGLKNIALPVQVHSMVMPWGTGTPTIARRRKSSSIKWAVAGALVLAGLILAYWGPWRKSSASPAVAVPGAVPGVVTTPPADAKSVAVLAFTNLSDDKRNEYFSDGVSEELLNVLAKVPGLKVSARTSAFHFKGKDTPIPEIARQLGVAYVVEGSVRTSGSRVRITAQLIKASDGFHVWSDNFDRELRDVLAIQDEIAGLIAKNLQLKLGAGNVAGAGATNVEALQLYLEARREWNYRTREGFIRAEELLRRALQLEPDFARAHAALADVWITGAGTFEANAETYGWRNSATVQKAIARAELAISLDPQSAEAYAALGGAVGYRSLADGIRALRRAVELNPNYASARQWLGLLLACDGWLEEGLAHLQKATELDPLSHRILDSYATVLVDAGRTGDALMACERALAIQPGAVQATMVKASALAGLGRAEEAIPLALEAASKKPSYSSAAMRVLVAARRPEQLRRFVDGAGGDVDPQFRFNSLLAFGRYDEALTSAKLDDFDVGLADNLLFDPFYDPVRSDSRFQKILADLGLAAANVRAQAWRKANPTVISERK